MDQITEELIEMALEEDIRSGDLTAEFFLSEDQPSQGVIVSRETGVIAGSEVAKRVFQRFDPKIEVEVLIADGGKVERGSEAMKISGKSRSLVTAERTALNFFQRLSGVASMTAQFVELIKPHPVKILDTRKTTPGWRQLQKDAVRAGGGVNHRMGLYDMVMVKDNHLLAEGGVSGLQRGIDALKAEHPEVKVELEADTLEQVTSFLELQGVDVVLLDNMSNDQLREAVKLVGEAFELEASGGVNLDTVAEIAATGVDAISVGALTHSAPSLDLSLEFTTDEV